jgi:hypothetical protein
MPPVDPTLEGRFLVHYNTGFRNHTMKFYHSGTMDVGTFQAFWNDLIDAVGPMLTASTLVGIDYGAPTSHVTNPVDPTGFTGTWGSGAADGRTDSRFVGFSGRDTSGSRWKIDFFGLNVAVTDNNFRFALGENGQVDAALGVLTSNIDFPRSILAQPVSIKSYANHGYNAYWQRKTR